MNSISLQKTHFGTTQKNEEVYLYTLTNDFGTQVDVITYGAAISSIRIPIENQTVDVALGFNNLDAYQESFTIPGAPYLGAIVGRFAGRITNATFELNGQNIQLDQNSGVHSLHGGNEGFSQKNWNVVDFSKNQIKLHLVSPDLDQNYPGNLSVFVTYTLTEANEIAIDYDAISDKDTVINLTHHTYFNLDGHQESVENQELYLQARHILDKTPDLTPNGNLISLENHPFDFSTPKKCPTEIDTTFVISDNTQVAASLKSSKFPLKMEVLTNQPAVHIYIGGNCRHISGKNEAKYHTNSGICFEAQNFPDAPNHPSFPNSILKANQTYQQKTIYRFIIS